MANKQSLPYMKLEAQNLKKPIVFSELSANMPDVSRYNGFNTLANVTSLVGNVIEKKKNSEFEKNRLKADGILEAYRQKLYDAQSVEEFDEIAKNSEEDLKAQINEGFFGKEFWNKNGDKILEANRLDVSNIKLKKEYEFGKNSLDSMLALNQNMLVNANGDKASLLLLRGLDGINQSDFISADDKIKYRDEYLKTGILNVALNNPDEASVLANKYFGSNSDELLKKISQAKILKEKEDIKKKEKEDFMNNLLKLDRANLLWQQQAKGDISDAQYYVLSDGIDKEFLFDDKKNFATPLADAYKIIKKIGAGDKVLFDDIKNASAMLVDAYRKNKIGIDEVSNLQNQLMFSAGNDGGAYFRFDNSVDEMLNAVLMDDVDTEGSNNVFAKDFMEEKAKIAFDVLENFYGKKLASVSEFEQNGGVVTPYFEKKIVKTALDEVKNELGFKENTGEKFTFSDLNKILNNSFISDGKNEVLQNFYKKAPFVDDKKALFKKLVLEQERKELKYPYFDNLLQVEEAGLMAGDKFYLNGRLAVKT